MNAMQWMPVACRRSRRFIAYHGTYLKKATCATRFSYSDRKAQNRQPSRSRQRHPSTSALSLKLKYGSGHGFYLDEAAISIYTQGREGNFSNCTFSFPLRQNRTWAFVKIVKMAGAVENGPKGNGIAALFESMEYGPAPESDKTAQVCLNALSTWYQISSWK